MSVINSAPYDHPFARGHSALIHVSPEGWVRGKASLDTDTGALTMTLGLETDNVWSGPKGVMTVKVLDTEGHRIAEATMTEPVGLPGKSPGQAVIKEYPMAVSIPRDVATKAATLQVEVQHPGQQVGPFGIPLDAIVAAIKVVVMVTSGA